MRPDGGVAVTPPEQFELACTAGVRGKCVRWGYRPWVADELALYGACTRKISTRCARTVVPA